MAKPEIIISEHKPEHASLVPYISGYLLSLYLTIFAYIVVTRKVWSSHVLLWVIAVLAIIQFFVQAVFFLHLGTETKPRWKSLVFGTMIVVVLILVFGSLWIMSNLNYHMMSPNELKLYLHTNEGL